MRAAPNYVVHHDYDPKVPDLVRRYAHDLKQSTIDLFFDTELLFSASNWQLLEEIFDKEILAIRYDDDDGDEQNGSFSFAAEQEARVMQHLQNLGFL